MPRRTVFSFLCALPALSGQTISLQDAVRSALAHHPGIEIEEAQVSINRGLAQIASGQFDSHVGASVAQLASQTPLSSLISGGQPLPADAANYGISWSRQFRSGVGFSQQISALRQGGTQPQIEFTLSLPMLRGRGRAAVDAPEIAAGINYDASLLDLSHAGAEAVLRVSTAYWNTLAALHTLDVLKQSEARANKLVEDTNLLIEADRLPRIDLEQLQANVADKTAARIAGEQALMEQRQQLGLAMGLTAEELDAAPLPSDVFPEPAGGGILPAGTRDYIQQALNRRADLQGARQREQAAKALATGARNGLQPNFTLSLTAGYGAVSFPPGAPIAGINGLPAGPNAAANLTYDVAVRNQAAIGMLAQAQARARQETLRAEDLARTIVSGVVTAEAAFSRSVAELDKAREATRHHQVAAAAEKEKFQHGLATLIDVVIADDRLTAATVNEAMAQARYSIAIGQLRFATGTFFEAGARTKSISAADLITPPSGEQP